jgi:hypothetical protein
MHGFRAVAIMRSLQQVLQHVESGVVVRLVLQHGQNILQRVVVLILLVLYPEGFLAPRGVSGEQTNMLLASLCIPSLAAMALLVVVVDTLIEVNFAFRP